VYPKIKEIKINFPELDQIENSVIYTRMCNILEGRINKKVVKTQGRQPQPAVSNEKEFRELFSTNGTQAHD